MSVFSRLDDSVLSDEPQSCPECSSTHLEEDYARAELVCADCGIVIRDRLIDPGQDWTAFDSMESAEKARTGGPVEHSLHDKGLTTEISWKNVDVYGRRVPARNKSQLYRIRSLQRRLRAANSLERNLMTSFCIIDRICSNMSLPKTVRESASMIYRNAVLHGVVKGRGIESVSAVSVYASSRMNYIPRTLEEISEVSGASEREIGRTYKILMRKLRLALPLTMARDYVPRFCSKLHLDARTEAKSMDILRTMESSSAVIGKGPQGSAAAAIYLAAKACSCRRSQEKVARASGITEATLRNRLKAIEKAQLDLSPEVVAVLKKESERRQGRRNPALFGTLEAF